MALYGNNESKRMVNNSSVTIVSILGRKGSGKNTVAQVLIDEYGFVEHKFADPLKNMLRAYYKYCGLSVIDIERRLEHDLKEQPDYFLDGKTPRHAMQTLGTEWRDMISPKLWANAVRDKINSLPVGSRVVITDNRFPQECKVLDTWFDPIYIRVFREIADKNPDKHISEQYTDMIPHDYSIINNDTIGSAVKKMRQIMKECEIGEIDAI